MSLVHPRAYLNCASAVMGKISHDLLQCKFCSATFTRLSNVRRHERIHQSDREFQCGVCMKCFREKHHLLSHHITMHTNLRVYSCSRCRRSFSDASNCQRHCQSHGVVGAHVKLHKNAKLLLSIELDALQTTTSLNRNVANRSQMTESTTTRCVVPNPVQLESESLSASPSTSPSTSLPASPTPPQLCLSNNLSVSKFEATSCVVVPHCEGVNARTLSPSSASESSSLSPSTSSICTAVCGFDYAKVLTSPCKLLLKPLPRLTFIWSTYPVAHVIKVPLPRLFPTCFDQQLLRLHQNTHPQ